MKDWKQNRQRKARFEVRAGTFDRDLRTVRAVLATDSWIDGPFGPEKLVITPESVNMSRAQHGLPWHDDHGQGGVGERIGRVTEIDIAAGRLVGTLQASRNSGGDEALNDIEDGIIAATSIGYRIDDAQWTEQGLLITKWTPSEVSTPSVVADVNAIIQRNASMPDDPTPTPQDTDAIRAAAQKEARDRYLAIDQAFRAFPTAQNIRQRAIDEDWSIDQAQGELLNFLGSQHQPIRPGADIVAGEDEIEKFVRSVGESLNCRALLVSAKGNHKETEEERRIRTTNPWMGWSLKELAREYLRRAGDSVTGDARSIVGKALTRAGIISHSTSDFANILVDASDKALQTGYDEAPETYEIWTSPGTLPDFKPGHRAQLSTFSDLDVIEENGEFTYGSFSDFKEVIQLLSYGKLFSISRQAIINDDLGAFTRAPRGMGRAARRKVGDLVYSVLSTNANMSDGNALFSAAHSNYVAPTAGGVPSVDTLNAGYTAMATQTDPAGNVLNITAEYIITAHALRGTTDALLNSTQNPAEGAATSFTETNIWFRDLTPVYDARIDADDAAKWYLATNPAGQETIEVAYLNGVRKPRVEREEGFTVDGVVMKVAHDVGVKALDWRGLYHNDGN